MELIYSFDIAVGQAVQSLHGVLGSFGDALFAFFSVLGEETFLIFFFLAIYWAVSKDLGELFILSIAATLSFNTTLKNIFMRPRPFDSAYASSLRYVKIESVAVDTVNLDPYSFPSGHAQIASTYLTGIALWAKKAAVWVICILLVLMVMLSRVYLGVHYPSDVIVGALLGAAISVAAWLLFKRFYARRFIVLLGVFALAMISVVIHPIPDNAKIAGIVLGMSIGLFIESKAVNFTVSGKAWKRVIRVVLGVAALMAIRLGLKAVLPETLFFEGLRYFAIGICATGIWPLAFKHAKWM